MGGGDLNLKKSWHPSTLRNIERVWKAEQKHEVERQKIEQLQKELAEERAREEIQTFAEDQGVVKKREERLDWMYQGPAAMVNREDYLMGRKIDKTLELLEQQETGVEPKKDDFDVGSTMFSSQDLSGTATVDLANKIREDPLFNIMKKEKEQRKNLLSNPVKMKQLQQLLQTSLGKNKSKKSKKYKKHSDSDSGERKQHKKHKRDKLHRHHSPEYEKIVLKEKSQDIYRKSKSSEDKNGRVTTSSYDLKDHFKSSFSRYRIDSSKHTYTAADSRSSNCSKHFHKDNERHLNFPHCSEDSRISYKSSHRERGIDVTQKRKLDVEQRNRRLKEMEDNAKWREHQRERNFKRYKDDDEKEASGNRMDVTDFIKPMLSKAAENGSVENRVKQKVFSLQRGNGVMNEHFARR